MAAEELTVRGLTGVDMTLSVAGPGTRSYAFVIDWHIRALLAVAWLVLARALMGPLGTALRGSLRSAASARPAAVLLLSVLPALAIYFLYHPVVELAMRGRTPGKRMAGVRIVTREGSAPGAGALLMRNLFRLIDSLPTFYMVGLACCFATAQRVRIGDIAAGTVLVLDEDASRRKSLGRMSALLSHERLGPDALQLVQDLLDRWGELDGERRTKLARALLARFGRRQAGEVDALDPSELRASLKALLAGE